MKSMDAVNTVNIIMVARVIVINAKSIIKMTANTVPGNTDAIHVIIAHATIA